MRLCSFRSELLKKLLKRRVWYFTQQSALLRRIVDRIRHSLELHVVLQTAVDEVAQALAVDQCVFFWYGSDLQQVQVVCERQVGRSLLALQTYPLDDLGLSAALLDQEEVIVHSGRSSGLPVIDWLRRQMGIPPQSDVSHQGLLSWGGTILVPVKSQTNLIGFMACLSHQARRWTMAETEFMQAIAQHLEIAIRQAQLYERTQKQARRERLVNQITTQTRQSLDLKKILREAIAQLLDVLDVDRCLVHLVEDLDDDEPAATSLTDESSQTVFRRKHLFEVCREPFAPSINDFDTDGPITRWVIQNRQQVVIADVSQDARIGPDNEEYRLAQIQSSLVVPSQADGRLQAILYFNQCSHKRSWSGEDQKLAQAIADQLAISIKQGHLYAQMRQQAIESAAQANHLQAVLQDLQHTQAQLIQSEKLSGLGQMVAGVAHEINNPISFIYGNIPYIEQYVQDLVRLLDHYQACCDPTHPQPEAARQALQDCLQTVELDFLLQDLPRILNSMQSGADRIRAIVQSLRNFSSLDEALYKLTDVHVGLDSTLSVLSHQLQPSIQVVRQYGELAPVKCYPRQLNQAFMNVLMNAIEALEQSPRTPKTITLTTSCWMDEASDTPWITVAIADNGDGIPAEIQSKIFDPFFTTKPVGQGTGLGLTVSYQTVVSHHHGKIACQSCPDQGTVISIHLPVRRPSHLGMGPSTPQTSQAGGQAGESYPEVAYRNS